VDREIAVKYQPMVTSVQRLDGLACMRGASVRSSSGGSCARARTMMGSTAAAQPSRCSVALFATGRAAVRSQPDEAKPQRVAMASEDPGCMVEVDPERFELMVSEALDGIPVELGELMSNVAVTVRHDSGPAGLLGLYQGVPLTRRSTFYSGALPDRITIYRRAICAVCNSEPEVVEQVRRTVIHEVGHHFGIGDARLRELGW